MKIITLKDKKLVGFRVVCETLEGYQQEIPLALERLTQQIKDINHVVSSNIIYGIFKVEALPEEDGYWKCIEVESFENIPVGMDHIVMKQGRYAALDYDGTPQRIQLAYESLHQWTRNNNLERNLNEWTIERYEKIENSRIECTIYDPIK
ncbi:putative transcriptional regulator YdeE [Bacillus pakistanensis]|uniref:Transcriptional regulator YdeE n=1 Tax=Rossellomorea pakistanensis TaxID=992288 RepID=A0ABS2NGP1_9BACI|nr:GyrI-like domain-containing protein [Bacillus pakistanensis]MBM7587000.1 putative transcriptional regulator YdeE [Bacillus pakistanensis]